METCEPLTSPVRRRRRIALVAFAPVLAALLVAWLESGNWLVIYNDGVVPLAEIQVRSGDAQWTVRDLEPRESRRWRVPQSGPAELSVEISNGSPETVFRQFCDWRETTIVTVRIDASYALVATSARGIWSRLRRW